MRLFSCFTVLFASTFVLTNVDGDFDDDDDYYYYCKSKFCFTILVAPLALLVAAFFSASVSEARLRALGNNVNMRRCNSSDIFYILFSIFSFVSEMLSLCAPLLFVR